MQLNEILEENSVKNISQKTNIPEDTINLLLNKEFEKLNKAQCMGFASIIEREYHADLSSLKEEINAYYAENGKKDTGVIVGMPLSGNRRRSKWFFLLILIALAYASWHFLTHYDKTHLNAIFPMNDESSMENPLEEKSIIEEGELNIINVIKQKWADVTRHNNTEKKTQEQAVMIDNAAVENVTAEEELTTVKAESQKVDEDTNSVSTESVEQNAATEVESAETPNQGEEQKTVLEKPEVLIVPVNRLWFGLINIETKERDHYSISEKFAVDVADQAWLAATSSAPFSLDDGVESKMFQDAREHYFILDKEGVKELSKAEYVALGGWDQW